MSGGVLRVGRLMSVASLKKLAFRVVLQAVRDALSDDRNLRSDALSFIASNDFDLYMAIAGVRVSSGKCRKSIIKK